MQSEGAEGFLHAAYQEAGDVAATEDAPSHCRSTESVWEVVKCKVKELKVAYMLPIKRQEMLLLQKMLPAIAGVDAGLLEENIDGISHLGR